MKLWRLILWGGAAVLLLAPALAMLLTREMNWGLGDFLAWGAMLVTACVAYELAARVTANRALRALIGAAIAGTFVLVWAQLAIQII